jgi:DNA-binding transcriptional regulator GbsR (MarR family)
MSLTPSMQRFIAHFGALGPRWGIAADTCRAHALLYLAGKPLPLPEIAKALDLTKAQARDTLADLAQWGMARPIADDRWDASGEPWDLLFAALDARRRRELPPALEMLRACRDEAAGDGTEPAVQGRLSRVLALVEDIAAIDVHARRVPPKALIRLVGLGGRAARLLSRAFPHSPSPA